MPVPVPNWVTAQGTTAGDTLSLQWSETAAPVPVVGLTAPGLAVTLSGTTATWTITDNSTNEDGHRLYRRVNGGAYSVTSTALQGSQALIEANTYDYYAVAYSGTTEGSPSPIRTVTPQATTTTGTPDPTLYPIADRTFPNWDAFTALNVPAMPKGWSYTDPTTGTLVRKVTDGTLGKSMFEVDYPSGGPHISLPWADGNYRVLCQTGGGNRNTVTVTPDAGFVAVNDLPRTPAGDLAFAWSQTTPHYGWMIQSGTQWVYCWDLRTNTIVHSRNFNPEATAAGGFYLGWLGVDFSDDWVTFMVNGTSTVVVWHVPTNTVYTTTANTLDEPHMSRGHLNGAPVVAIIRGTNHIDVWYLYDRTLVRDVVSRPLDTAHLDWEGRTMRMHTTGGYYTIGDKTWSATYYFPSKDDDYTQPSNASWGYRAGQWNTSGWYVGSNYGAGYKRTWTAHANNIWSVPISAVASSTQYSVGIRYVAQSSQTNNQNAHYTLKPGTGPTALTQGQFFWDSAARVLYVRLHGDRDPHTDILEEGFPPAVLNGLGFTRFDGMETRVIAIAYLIDPWPFSYGQQNRATISPDGKLIVWNSNAGIGGGRTDLYATKTKTS